MAAPMKRLWLCIAALGVCEAEHPPVPQERHDPGPLGGADGFLLDAPTRSRLAALPPLPPLIMVKVPKTAGSTMTNVMHRLGDWRNLTFLLPENDVVLDFKGRTVRDTARFNCNLDGQRRTVRQTRADLIVNHGSYHAEPMHAAVDRPSGQRTFVMTVLREPASHLQSAYNWFTAGARDKYDRNVDRFLDALQSRGHGGIKFAYNPQAQYLGWKHYARRHQVSERDARAVRQWVSSTLAELELVLLTEQMEEGLLLLRHTLNRSVALQELAVRRFKDAAGTESRYVPFSAAQKGRVRNINRLDAELYAAAASRFRRQWESLPQHARAELQQLREANERLARACDRPAPRRGRDCPQAVLTGNVAYSRHLKRRLAASICTPHTAAGAGTATGQPRSGAGH